MATSPRWHSIQWPASFANGRRIVAEDLNSASGATQFLLGGGPNAATNAPRWEVSGNCAIPSTAPAGGESKTITANMTNVSVATDTAGKFNSSTGIYTVLAPGWYYVTVSVTAANTGSTNDQGVFQVGIQSSALYNGGLTYGNRLIASPCDRAQNTGVSSNTDMGATASAVIYTPQAGYGFWGNTTTMLTQTSGWPGTWYCLFSGIWLSA